MTLPYEINILNGSLGDPAILISVKRSGELILFDLGDLEAASHKELLKVRHAFVSHTHVDHFMGFDRLLRFNIPHRKKMSLYGPKGFSKNVQHKVLGYTWNLIDDDQLPFLITELEAEGAVSYEMDKGSKFQLSEPIEANTSALATLKDGSTVVGFPLDHKGISSISYVISSPKFNRIDQQALDEHNLIAGPWISEFLEDLQQENWGKEFELNGKYSVKQLKDLIVVEGQKYSLGYITDVGFTPGNINIISSEFPVVDCLICETSFLDKDLDRAVSKAHLTTKQAALIAVTLGATTFQPFHVSNIYDGKVEDVLDEAQGFFEDFKSLSQKKLKELLLLELERAIQCKSDFGEV